jgi:hypothetical protein
MGFSIVSRCYLFFFARLLRYVLLLPFSFLFFLVGLIMWCVLPRVCVAAKCRVGAAKAGGSR